MSWGANPMWRRAARVVAPRRSPPTRTRAGVGAAEPGDDRDQRRLPRAVRPEQARAPCPARRRDRRRRGRRSCRRPCARRCAVEHGRRRYSRARCDSRSVDDIPVSIYRTEVWQGEIRVTFEPLTPERRRAQTRRHLLEAAAIVFARKGFHARHARRGGDDRRVHQGRGVLELQEQGRPLPRAGRRPHRAPVRDRRPRCSRAASHEQAEQLPHIRDLLHSGVVVLPTTSGRRCTSSSCSTSVAYPEGGGRSSPRVGPRAGVRRIS